MHRRLMRSTVSAIVIAAVFASGRTPTGEPVDLIVNGSFEDFAGDYRLIPGGSSLMGWLVIGPGVEQLTASRLRAGSAKDGRLMLDLNADGASGGGIRQTIPTIAGASYTLRFYASTIGGCGGFEPCTEPRNGTGSFVVTVGSETLNVALSNGALTVNWSEYTLDFTATSTATNVQFQSFDEPLETFVFLDSVSVTGGDDSTLSLSILSGDNQTGSALTTLSEPLVVRVTDSDGSPVNGVPILFEVTRDPSADTRAILSAAGASTHLGLASTELTLGDGSGTYQVTATCGGEYVCAPESVTFTARGGFGRVKVWLNSFIPRNLPFTSPIELSSRPAPIPYLGQTMFGGPFLFLGPWNPRFLTDQRSFSSLLDAESRMQSLIEIEMNGPSVVNGPVTGTHRTDRTRMFFVIPGPFGLRAVTVCSARASTREMRFGPIDGGPVFLTINLVARAGNPCLPGSPNIDYEGTLTINALERTVTFNGRVSEFPAFEMYASVDDGPPRVLFRRPPELGKNPYNLFGGPTIELSGRASF